MDVKVKGELREEGDGHNKMEVMKVKEALKQGLAATNQLSALYAESRAGGVGKEDEALVAARMKDYSSIMLKSFDTAISILKAVQVKGNKHDPPSDGNASRSRSYFNRRTTQPRPVKTITTFVATEDGYSWRKYGQKPIVNAKHPREYFRCGNKDEAGCRATKQIQMIEENPTKYSITYYGNHTCPSNNTSHEFDALMLGSYEEECPNANMLSFEHKSDKAISTSSIPEQGLHSLSMIFSSSSLESPSNARINFEQDVKIQEVQEIKPSLQPHNDHQYPPAYDTTSVAMETPAGLYSPCPNTIFSPHCVDDLDQIDYGCFMADCAEFDGGSQDLQLWELS